jgi:S-adenosylmethionine/arginine decarboxylase-like enzyme
MNKSPSDLQCSDLYYVIVTGEAFLKLISLQSVSQLLMCQKRDERESDQVKHLEESFGHSHLDVHFSPRYNFASISHYCCHNST